MSEGFVRLNVTELRVEAKSYRTNRVSGGDIHTNGLVSVVFHPEGGKIPVIVHLDQTEDGSTDIEALAKKLLVMAQEGVNVTIAEAMEFMLEGEKKKSENNGQENRKKMSGI